MKWTATAAACSALLALAAVVLLGRGLQQQVAGAVAAPTTSQTGLAGLSLPAAANGQALNPASTAAPPVAPPATAPVSTASPPAPALLFSYVGHWTERGRTQVVLQRDGISFTVQGPGRLDDAYEVLAISAQQLTLLHRASGARHLLVFVATGAATAPVGATATEAGVAGRGLLQAAPVGVVPPSHAPANMPGDTEDQQESN
jgi:hypothetical protein